MPEAAAKQLYAGSMSSHARGHSGWVRFSHWTIVVAFLTLTVTGVLILMVHPRLYWGEVGNDLTPALLEIPISNNHRPEGWETTVTFTGVPATAVSADRGYSIFNQNGWARSLHFLAGWLLVLTGLCYALAGLATGHTGRDLLPRLRELSPRELWRDLREHLPRPSPDGGGGPPYGLLQKCAYAGVLFIALPLMVVTGMTMAPAITAAVPALLDLFGGYQSARTIHFFCFTALLLFLVAHVAMVVLTGFRRQLRAMILGK